jgi:predicted nucleic acid-binding protein
VAPSGSDALSIGRTLYSRAILIDTGAFVALALRSDDHHSEAKACLKDVMAQRLPVAVAFPTLVEAHRLILQRGGIAAARSFLRDIVDGGLEIVHVGESDYDGALRIIDLYPFVALTLHDALCAAVMLDRSIGSVFTFDDDFFQIGLVRVPPLQPLPDAGRARPAERVPKPSPNSGSNAAGTVTI